VRSGLITLEQVAGVELFRRFHEDALREFPHLQGRRVLYESIRRMLSAQVYDVIDATSRALRAAAPADPDEARRAGPLVRFSDGMRAESAALKGFLLHNLYRHPQVMATTARARRIVHELFAAYTADPRQMGDGFAARADRERAVADYIAGMTDRFAAREHERITGQRLFP
jgi:dGTPase